jgi:anhydro-N-acetylmuramic acid kinase
MCESKPTRNESGFVEGLVALYGKRRKTIIGLMSGTSADGVGTAIVEIEGIGRGSDVCVLASETFPYRSDLRSRLLACGEGKSSVEELCQLNILVGESFAEAALKICEISEVPRSSIDAIGSHGQTVCHIPMPEKGQTRCTLQIGEPCVIAERTRITTVFDFHLRDVAAGGVGSPVLTPVADYVLFASPDETVVVINIGGIGNPTVLPANCTPDEVITFDTGPGNMVIDGIVSLISNGQLEYDEDGRIAARGSVSLELLAELMDHPYIRKRPPKATGREVFGRAFAESVLERGRGLGLSDEDIVATVTAYTVESLVYNLEKFGASRQQIDRVVVGGGGVRNRTLMQFLREKLGGTPVQTHEDYGIDSHIREAVSVAIVANEILSGGVSHFPSATGARRAVTLGKIIPAS